MNTKQIIMSRVHTVHFMRPIVSASALSAFVFLLALYGIGREVWVARVFENMPSPANILAFLRFFEVAFLNTTFLVQALSIVSVGAVVFLARETARAITLDKHAVA